MADPAATAPERQPPQQMPMGAAPAPYAPQGYPPAGGPPPQYAQQTMGAAPAPYPQPGYGGPPPPGYGAPQQGQYMQQPPPGYGAPQQMQQQPPYGAPQQQPYMQPQGGYPQQGQPMMMPGQPMPGGVMVVAPPGSLIITPTYPDLMSALAASPGLFIKQRISILEMITACEMANVYEVWQWDPVKGKDKVSAGKSAQKIATFRERSNCCHRNFCGAQRGFKMSLVADEPLIGTAYTERSAEPDARADGIHLERPFICATCLFPWLCCMRPVMHVRNKDGYFATAINPCTCIRRTIRVGPPIKDDYMEGAVNPALASAGVEPWYIMRADFCQFAAFCPVPLPCGPCKKYTFDLYKPSDAGFTSPIGAVSRVWPGCLEAMLTDADAYTVTFPPDATPFQKAAVTAATVFADFLYFEKKPKDNSSSGISINL